MTKDYVIYSAQLARYLTKKGFEIKNTEANFNNPKYKVYYFEDTAELRSAVSSYVRP